jgi:hypothetical protein
MGSEVDRPFPLPHHTRPLSGRHVTSPSGLLPSEGASRGGVGSEWALVWQPLEIEYLFTKPLELAQALGVEVPYMESVVRTVQGIKQLRDHSPPPTLT